jgi:hypothetical protein
MLCPSAERGWAECPASLERFAISPGGTFCIRGARVLVASRAAKVKLNQVLAAMLRKLFQNANLGARGKVVLGVAILFGGIPSLIMGQVTRAPESSTSAQTTIQEVSTYSQPPPGFDPLMASDEQLERYGFPPRPVAPKASEAYRHWQALVSVLRTANPILHQTTIYNGHAENAPAKRGP